MHHFSLICRRRFRDDVLLASPHSKEDITLFSNYIKKLIMIIRFILLWEIDVLEIFDLKLPFDKEPTGISEGIECIVIVLHIYLSEPTPKK